MIRGIIQAVRRMLRRRRIERPVRGRPRGYESQCNGVPRDDRYIARIDSTGAYDQYGQPYDGPGGMPG